MTAKVTFACRGCVEAFDIDSDREFLQKIRNAKYMSTPLQSQANSNRDFDERDPYVERGLETQSSKVPNKETTG